MSFADRRRSSGAFIEGRKLSIHSGESFRSHGGELVNGGGGGGGVKWKRETYKTQQLKITFSNELRLRLMHNFIAGVATFAS